VLVSWNGAARFQNYRYYMPALAMVLVASALGLAALSRWRAGAAVGGAIAAIGVALAIPQIPAQIAFFRDASANVHGQQVEVGRRLAARMAPGARVLVGDAGAIPYVADRGAIDALGLGGFGRLPFVLAATQGEAATIELIERLAPAERPAFLALYPNWFAQTTSTFGREIDRVTIDHNVICGGVTKGIYAADWSALAARDDEADAVDAIDVADVLSERAHAYESPAPDGGWTLLDVRRTAERSRLFDAGRIIPEGRCERFTIARGGDGPRELEVRTNIDVSADVEVRHARGGSEQAALILTSDARDGAWRIARATLASGAARGDVVSLCARRGPLHDFHVWLTAPGISRR
jgi:hypothetical protein